MPAVLLAPGSPVALATAFTPPAISLAAVGQVDRQLLLAPVFPRTAVVALPSFFAGSPIFLFLHDALPLIGRLSSECAFSQSTAAGPSLRNCTVVGRLWDQVSQRLAEHLRVRGGRKGRYEAHRPSETETGVDPSSVTMRGCWFPKYVDQLGQCSGQLDPLRTITIANDEGTMGRNCL